MRSSKSRGFAPFELIICLVIITLVLGLAVYKTSSNLDTSTRVRATMIHLQMMARLIENQKRALGAYPLSLAALREKNIYLTTTGNRAGYASEIELRTPWNGPYLKKHNPYKDPSYLPDVVYKINLAELYPAMEGELGYLFEAPNVLAYTITNENAPRGGEENFNTFAQALIKKCNNTDTVPIPPRARNLSHSYVTGTAAQPCGYAAYRDQIEYVTYYITRYE